MQCVQEIYGAREREQNTTVACLPAYNVEGDLLVSLACICMRVYIVVCVASLLTFVRVLFCFVFLFVCLPFSNTKYKECCSKQYFCHSRESLNLYTYVCPLQLSSKRSLFLLKKNNFERKFRTIHNQN